MITIVKADGTAEQQQIAAMRERAAKTGAALSSPPERSWRPSASGAMKR